MNPSDKQWYVFTFGVGQKYGGHYVRFYGTYEEAREKMVRYFGLTWAFQYSEEQWSAAVKRLTDRGRGLWIERELTKIEYMQGLGLSITAQMLNDGVFDDEFDEEFAEKIQTLLKACREIGKEAADE